MLNRMSNLGQRTIVGGITTLFVWLVIYLSFTLPILFILMIVTAIIGALKEFYRIGEAKGFQPLFKIASVCTVLYVLTVYLIQRVTGLALFPPEIILLLSMAACFGYFFIRGSNPLGNIAITLFGIAYLVLPLVCLMKVNYFFGNDAIQDGRCWLLYLLTVTKMTDTGAYFFGKNLGKTPLASQISPRKTVEGALGGTLIAVTFSVLFHLFSSNFPQYWPMQISLWQSIWLGLLISLAAQFGDLAESMLKRDANIKDSNNLPGLGGALDIVDSMIFTAPLVYLFLIMHYTIV